MFESKRVVDSLIHEMQNRPETFVCTTCILEDKKTGYHYWVGNGVPFYGIDKPYEMCFGFIQGYRFGKAVRQWKAWTAINEMSREDNND